jgi:hypothetical protein
MDDLDLNNNDDASKDLPKSKSKKSAGKKSEKK